MGCWNAILSSVLNSDRAILVNNTIMRTSVQAGHSTYFVSNKNITGSNSGSLKPASPRVKRSFGKFQKGGHPDIIGVSPTISFNPKSKIQKTKLKSQAGAERKSRFTDDKPEIIYL